MRASEFLIEDSSETIQNALENWMEMESTPNDIQAILSSPESAPYKKPPNIKWLYRAIVPKNRDINSIKSTGQVVAFATDMQGAINFIRTLEIQDDWVIIRKPFNPSDFLLDFTGMYEAIAQGAQSERYIKEHEVWMKPTAEYTTAKKNEIVYSSKEDDNRLTEAKVSVKDQLINKVKQDGGRPEEYFVRFTDIDKLGFSAKQKFGRSVDIDHPDYYPDYIGSGKGNPALWFYPLKTYMSDDDLYAIEKPYVWLVRLKPNAWLQPVDRSTTNKLEAPQGKERVGMMKNIRPFPAAIFFKQGFDVVDKFYDYGSQHKRHGEVKGPSKEKPSFFDRVRGYT